VSDMLLEADEDPCRGGLREDCQSKEDRGLERMEEVGWELDMLVAVWI
jgi:hypothetical protein